MSWKVIQILETGEECCPYEGTEAACAWWITENIDQYPESHFRMQGPSGIQYVSPGEGFGEGEYDD